MIKIDEIGAEKLERINALLHHVPNGVRDATYNALSRAASKGKMEAARLASERYTISMAAFRKNCNTGYHIHYEGGKVAGGVVGISLSFAGRVIPLIQFSVKGSKSGGVYAYVKDGGGNLPHAWIGDIHGHAVWDRIGKGRYAIEKKFGPSTGHMMQDESVSEKMAGIITATFDSRIEHEITRILSGY